MSTEAIRRASKALLKTYLSTSIILHGKAA